MNILLWVIQIILAIKLVTAAVTHGLQQSKPTMQQAAEKMGKPSRFWHVFTAIVTFLAAICLILPGWLGFYPQIVVWAAVLSALLMLVSIYFHVKFREKPNVFVSVVLLAFAVFIAYGRFVLVPF